MDKSKALAEPQLTVELRTYRVTIETSLGSLEMLADARAARRAVSSFLYLAHEGFYDNREIFRLIPNFIA